MCIWYTKIDIVLHVAYYSSHSNVLTLRIARAHLSSGLRQYLLDMASTYSYLTALLTRGVSIVCMYYYNLEEWLALIIELFSVDVCHSIIALFRN